MIVGKLIATSRGGQVRKPGRAGLLVLSLLVMNLLGWPTLAGAAGISGSNFYPTSEFSQIAAGSRLSVANGEFSTLLNAKLDSHNALQLAATGYQPPKWSGEWSDFGLYSALPQYFSQPFNALRANWQAEMPEGTQLQVDVRASQDGQNWTLWQILDKSGQVARFEGGQNFVYAQYRVRMFSRQTGLTPTFQGLTLEANQRAVATSRFASLSNIAQAAPAAATQPPTYQVYATREGLAGSTTANGHVIQSHDHFVSLPSWTALSDLGKWDYKVQISVPGGKTATAPVWDSGPWNFHDDYWHNPRHEFKDLPVGVPEAEKAAKEGYNNGLNESGRRVYNPSGIDIGDGTWWDDLGLQGAMLNNKISVTFLWEGNQIAAPEISGVQAYGTWQNGVQIKWNSSTPASSWVEYGRTTDYGQQSWVYQPLGTSHNRVLTDLVPGMTYNYRVHNKDAYGNEAVSPNFTFTTPAGSRANFVTFQNDKGISLTKAQDNSNLVLLGARVNPSFWNDNPKADFLAGATATGLGNTGNLDLDFGAVCNPPGKNCTMGYGSGYKNFVRFTNGKGETLEIGVIHDAALSPGSVTLMVEGNFADGSKLRRYNPPDSLDQKVSHHFHFAWQGNHVNVMLDNTAIDNGFDFNLDGLNLSLIGAGRAKDDIVAASFQNIAFSYDALPAPAK